MGAPRRITVVGASLAGTRAIQALRDRGFDGEIALVGAEQHLPYDRPPLSKSLLAGASERSSHALLSAEDVDALRVELHLGAAATTLLPDQRVVQLADGMRVAYDALIIATGCEAWMPPEWRRFDGVHQLRTLDDCLALRDDLQGCPRVVVVGAGFIGCEVASTARQLGLDVTLVDPLPAPMWRALGPSMAEPCTALHARAGVRVRCSAGVAALEGHSRVERVRLTDGAHIDADVVIVGIGVRPCTGWLVGSGIAIGNGVVCDERCATNLPDVYAAGDIARWHNPLFGADVRVEHWTNASEHGSFVARAICEGSASGPLATVPFVWSEQHGARIEIAGMPGPEDRVHVVDGSMTEPPFVALYERDGRFNGALAINAPRQLLRYRRLLALGASWREVEEEALGIA